MGISILEDLQPGEWKVLCVSVCVCVCVRAHARTHTRTRLVTQPCPILCKHLDCSLPGSSVHGVFLARILEWVATSSCRGSSPPRDQN